MNSGAWPPRLLAPSAPPIASRPARRPSQPPIQAAAALASGLCSLTLLGCQPSKPPDQLVVASRGTVDSVDPVDVTTLAGLQLLSAIGDSLYSSDASGRITPRLATALPRVSEGGRIARIPLRQGVRFHDGTPFNAAAMVFSLERFRALGKLSYLLDERISAIRARGPHELELELKRPYGALAALLSSSSLTPLSPAAYRQYRNRSLGDRFIGTGPYRLVRYTPDQQSLRPFSGYWGPQPRNRGLQLVSLSNSTALYGALISAEVDLLLSQGLESDQQRDLARRSHSGQLVQAVGPALEIGYLTLLSDRPPLDQPRLRQAVALSLDRRLISERVTYGMRSPLRSVVPPPLPGSSPPSWPAYNPQGARRLLRSAGYCHGRRLNLPLTFRSNVPADRLFALTWQAQLQRDLADCLSLTITGVESTTAYRQLDKGAFPMIVLDWTGDYPAADVYVTPLLACDRSSGFRCLEGSSASFGSFWSAPGLQSQLQASEALQGAALAQQLERIQRRTAAGAAYIPLWQTAPRAWGRPQLAPAVFDGSGRVVLQQLHRRRA